jgi:hypothetical protein
MIHVKQIENLIEQAKNLEAEDALESLLELGPNNVAALKLKAKLSEFKGNFEQEHALWKQIYQIDPEDQESHRFFQLRQLETQEHHYFTDVLPEGTHKMLTYQRPLLKPMVFGFLGSLGFIAFTHYAETTLPSLMKPGFLFSAFFVFVTLPLIFVIYRFLTTMYSVSMNDHSICVSTRLKKHTINWADLAMAELVYDGPIVDPQLSLRLTPKDENDKPIEIDLSKSTTSIRSVAMFLKEFKLCYSAIESKQGSKAKTKMASLNF